MQLSEKAASLHCSKGCPFPPPPRQSRLRLIPTEAGKRAAALIPDLEVRRQASSFQSSSPEIKFQLVLELGMEI